jgi:hypothetical protein
VLGSASAATLEAVRHVDLHSLDTPLNLSELIGTDVYCGDMERTVRLHYILIRTG